MKRVWLVVVVAQVLGVGACKWEDVVAAGCDVVKYGDGRTGEVGDVLEETCGFVDSYVSPLEGPVFEDHIEVFLDDPELDDGECDEAYLDEDGANEVHGSDEVFGTEPEGGT